ncbi:MAG: hypothetical protein J6B31_04355 [Bacteroidaceae bacterium]|nr:hypothetical protein [Bacteroidaceae bacterium]
MKRNLILLFVCMCSLIGHAQNKFNLSDVSSLTFYGIDFTIAKVYGGKDTGHQYWATYADINELFIMKPKMYSIEKRLGIPVDVTSLEAVNEANKKINPDHIKTTEPNYMPTEEQITEAVKKLPILSREEKTGLVIVALFLNKEDDRGTYQFVVFNTKTREIIEQWTNSGKALGIGLKNYWGYSVYNAIKKIK